MALYQYNFSEESNHKIDVVKAQMRFKSKGEAVEYILSLFNLQTLDFSDTENTIKKEG